MKKYTLPHLPLVLMICLLTFLLLSCAKATNVSTPSTLVDVLTPVPTVIVMPEPKTYPEASPYPMLYPISSLYFSTENIANTEGYVVHYQQNPECPDGVRLKPCLPSYIIVSENNLPIDDVNRLSNQQVVIQVDNPLQFARLTNYRFTITDVRKVGWSHFGANLLGYSESEVARNVDSISDEDEEIIQSIFAFDSSELSCNEPLVASLIEQYKDNMLACETNNDCIAMMPTCGTQNQLIAVNRVFALLHEYLQSSASACVECMPASRAITNLRCENNQCMADFVAQ